MGLEGFQGGEGGVVDGDCFGVGYVYVVAVCLGGLLGFWWFEKGRREGRCT